MSPTHSGSTTTEGGDGTPTSGVVGVPGGNGGEGGSEISNRTGSSSPNAPGKLGWDNESLSSPPYGTPTGSPYRAPSEPPKISNVEISGPEGGGGPPTVTATAAITLATVPLSTTPRLLAKAVEAVGGTLHDGLPTVVVLDDDHQHGGYSVGNNCAAATASPSPPPPLPRSGRRQGEQNAFLSSAAITPEVYSDGAGEEEQEDRRLGDVEQQQVPSEQRKKPGVRNGRERYYDADNGRPFADEDDTNDADVSLACSDSSKTLKRRTGGLIGRGRVVSTSPRAVSIMLPPSACSTPSGSPTNKYRTGAGGGPSSINDSGLLPETSRQQRGRAKEPQYHGGSSGSSPRGGYILASPRLTLPSLSCSPRATRRSARGFSPRASRASSQGLGFVATDDLAELAAAAASGFSPRAAGGVGTGRGGSGRSSRGGDFSSSPRALRSPRAGGEDFSSPRAQTSPRVNGERGFLSPRAQISPRVGGGGGFVLSPRVQVSPRAGFGSPRAGGGRISSRAGLSPRAAFPEGMDWWNELELSPSRVEMPGLQRWR